MEFIDSPQQLLNAYKSSFDPVLISLSILVAITSAFTAFGIVERINNAEKQYIQSIWIIFGAIVMGLGIWSMHFIGSLALKLPVPISYNLKLTLLSVMPAILVSAAVLWLMIQTRFNQLRLLLCGIFLGLGVANMHFIGIMAMQLQGKAYYIPNLLVVAAIIAVLFATVALHIQFEAADEKSTVGFKQIKSAIVMGFAVSGMYYTVMHATVFLPAPISNTAHNSIDSTTLAYILSLVILLILLLAIMTPLALRFRQLSFELKQEQEKLRIAATAFQTHDAIMITDANTNIISVNKAFCTLTGYKQSEAIGKTPRFIQSEKHNKILYLELWQHILAERIWSGEIVNQHKNGTLLPSWQTVSTVYNAQNQASNFVVCLSDISKLKDNEQEIERLAFYDPLTDLPNRRLLQDQLEHEFSAAKRYQRNGALLFLDLDRFKNINDSLGHAVGDEILKQTATRLLSILRASDVAVRLGGDEYVVLIPAQNEQTKHIASQAQSVAKKIIHHINQPYAIKTHKLYISTSIGISLFSGHEESPEIILTQADTAMYKAKESGRNTYKFYQQSMQVEADKRLNLEKNLRTACSRNELGLQYQIQITSSGSVLGAEALIRWSHPEMGLISPEHFIPIAEETGIILEIGEWTLKTVCHQIKQFDQQGVIIPHIAINISLKQFHQKNFVATVTRIVADAEIEPARLLLEITESVFLQNIEDTIGIMNELKQNGFSFAIDDFGTGYASLSYLQRLPFDQLKIDQTFINELLIDPTNRANAIVKAIIIMAKNMNLSLIAEGVETRQQRDLLLSYGCHNFQGYYYSWALPAEQFALYHQSIETTQTEN